MSYQKNILIVDDDFDLCIVLKHYFLRKNYEVHFATSIKQGIQMYNEFSPDLIYIGKNFREEWDKKNISIE